MSDSDNRCEHSVQGGNERPVHSICRDSFPVQVQIHCGARVGSQFHPVAVIHRCPYGGVHTHMGHHSAYKQRIHLQALQASIQSRLQETVRIALYDNPVSLFRPDPLRYLRSFCSLQEESIIRRIEMLYVNNRPAFPAAASSRPGAGPSCATKTGTSCG